MDALLQVKAPKKPRDEMAIKISSGESIKKAILSDALLRSIIEKIEVNTTGLAPIAGGPSVGILGIPTIDGFEATWNLNVIGLTTQEGNQFITTIRSIFPGSTFKVDNSVINVEIFSLVTKEILDAVEEQKKIKEDQERTKRLESAIQYATSLKSGQDGQSGSQGIRGPQGLKGDPGERGPAGRDGKDLVATEAELNDLKDVFIVNPKVGQVLTWDGSDWVALFIPQTYKFAGGGSQELDCGNFDP